MMKYIYRTLILAAIVTIAWGCEDDFLDVNESPNTAVVAPTDQLFTGAIVETINNRTQYLQQYGNYYTQHFVSGNVSGFLTDWERYRETTTLISIWSNNFWNSYTNIQTFQLAGEEALASGFNNTAAQSLILASSIYLDLSLLHEEVPYSEANVVGITDPNFDSQEDIFNGLIADLDSAVALIDVNEGGAVSGGDFFYGGSMENWLKFANSLKFKIIMLKAESDPNAGAELAAFMATNPSLFESSADNAQVNFVDETGQQNPGWALFDQFGAWNFDDPVAPGSTVNKEGQSFAMFLTPIAESILSQNYTEVDPRLNLLFRPQEDNTTYETLDINEAADSDAAAVDENIYQPIYPDYFLTYSEIQLLMAEAILRGFITGDAQAAYEAGARASIERYNGLAQYRQATTTEIDDYINALPTLSSAPVTPDASTALEHVYLQMYADSYLRGLKGWTDYRRTGYPTLTIHPESLISTVIKRWPYDQDEPNINSNFPSSVAALDDPMWFER